MRDRVARGTALAALALATLGARAAPRPTESPRAARVTLAPAVVLDRYAAALAKLPRPKAVSFEYTVEQLGLRTMEQTHRVYRSGLNERDETLVVDSYALTRPSVRIFNNRTYRYDVASIAPTPANYAFTFMGIGSANDSYTYVFRTEPRTPRLFAVSEIEIDSRLYLPSIVRFKVAGGGARGSGDLQYGRSEVYWLVRAAHVNAHLTDGTAASESITWSNYQFPASLPRSTFDVPRPVATEGPGALLAP